MLPCPVNTRTHTYIYTRKSPDAVIISNFYILAITFKMLSMCVDPEPEYMYVCMYVSACVAINFYLILLLYECMCVLLYSF